MISTQFKCIGDSFMKLDDITNENWEDVIFLSTNETITVKGCGEPYEA